MRIPKVEDQCARGGRVAPEITSNAPYKKMKTGPGHRVPLSLPSRIIPTLINCILQVCLPFFFPFTIRRTFLKPEWAVLTPIIPVVMAPSAS